MTGKPKRVFICAERRFPRGDAGANRVQYIARALMQAGHEVIVISIGKHRAQDYCEQSRFYIYNDVKYKNVPVRDGIYKRWDANIVSGRNTVKIIRDLDFCSSDIALIYTTNAIYGQILNDYCHNKIGATVVMDVVEKFQPFQYRCGCFNLRYLLFKYCFRKVYSRSNKIITVSRHLEKHFDELSLRVLRLPALIDSTEYVVKKQVNDGIIRLIYPGNIGRKEALGVMLQALLMLSDSEKSRVELHLTGNTKKELLEILGNQSFLLEQLKGLLHIHNWMTYESLLELYNRSDFLLFARNQNEATLSNFPSKVPELLACGIATIANKIGDFSDYLQDGIDSILFEKCTAEDCCAAIRKALDLNYEQLMAMRDNARKCAEQQFDFRLWSDKIHAFLES